MSTFTPQPKSGTVEYITTDTPDYVLVGLSSDQYLVWQDITTFTNQAKH